MTPLMKESAVNLRNAYGEFITTDDLTSIRIGSKQRDKFTNILYRIKPKYCNQMRNLDTD